MAAARLRRAAVPLAALLMCTSSFAAPVRAQTAAECRQTGGSTPEDFGPTDITGVSGNRRLSAAVNAEGSVTVLRWPSPSYYDQIKYRTTDRDEPHMGSLPNEGAFVGVAWRATGNDEWTFAWMRDALETDTWSVRQRFADDDTDEIVTTYSNPGAGLTLKLRDVVSSTRDALVRRVKVTRTEASEASRIRLFSFANFNPVFSKAQRSPYRDWCAEERNDSGASFVPESDAIVAEASGIDESTGRSSSVALAMGFTEDSSQHQVGQDTYGSATLGTSAYDDAQDGELTGVSIATGQADAAVAVDLDLSAKTAASTSTIIAAGPSQTSAIKALEETRKEGAASVARAKARWWRSWLDGTRLPKDAPSSVTDLATRALISMRQAADPGGLIVSSISTQPTFSLDWIRDGAYINRALNSAKHAEMVKRHNIRYADLQATAASNPPGGETTPPGNWAQNFYADGVVGGPIPYEVDETGLGIWTLWDHYARTRDADYLLRVYEAIQRAAQYLTDVCRDPATGLQCAASEGDNPSPTRTLRGAQAVWLGLDAAARAAEVKADLTPSARADARANARKWRDRRDEVADGILDSYYDEGCECFTDDPGLGGTFLWPARAIDFAGGVAQKQADANWAAIKPSLDNSATAGGDEPAAILGNAYTWTKRSQRKRLKSALRWIATVPTTNRTGILGAAWSYPEGGSPPQPSAIVTMQGQPHVPSLAMFYLAALKTYGSEPWRD